MEEKKVLVNNLEVNYKVEGEGRPFLILHGWPSSSDSWVNIQKKISEKGYKVVCPDFPGFGKSDDPKEPWSVGDYKKWTIDFIDKLKFEKFVLLAHSFGGRIAIKIASQNPERLEKLILCGSAGIRPRPGIRAFLVRLLAESGNCIFSIKFLDIFKGLARNLLYLFIRRSDYVKSEGVMRETLKKVVGEDLRFYLSGIKTKTLLVWGEDDKLVPIKYAKIFKKNISDSQLITISGVGHGPHLESPDELSKIISDFLK